TCRRERDVLPSVHLIGHWAHRDFPPGIHLPQQFAGAGVERLEDSFAASGEQQVRSGSEDSAGGHLVHLEVPLLLARVRIDAASRAVALLVALTPLPAPYWTRHPTASPPEELSFFESICSFRIGDTDVFPKRDVEQAGPGTERRRKPVRAVLF